MSRPRLCAGCGSRPVAHKGNKYCFDCRPPGRGARRPPPCRSCGSTDDYYSAGKCARCHRLAPRVVDSCRDCLAWGVTRTLKWLCHACVGWRESYPERGACGVCGEERHLGRGGYCRLCWRTASDIREATRRERPYRPLDVVGANRNGQQLFFADMRRPRADPTPQTAPRPQPARTYSSPRCRARQLSLLDQPQTWAVRHGIPDPPDPAVAAALDERARDLAARHGWSSTHLKRVRLGLHLALGIEQTPGTKVRASTVVGLSSLGRSGIDLVLMVLEDADMLDDDRIPAVDAWFEQQVETLPPKIVEELNVWFDVMRHGSLTAPRRRPRAETTIRLHLLSTLPTIRTWAEAGHASLREISRNDFIAALPDKGNPRAVLGSGLRSIFKVLKSKALVFVNPTAGIRTGRPERRQPLPLDVSVLREGLDSDDPARAALTAMLAFHGLRPGELRHLKLTDVRGGHLYVAHRRVVLAPPVRQRLSIYLDYRNSRWPRTANPHLFVHPSTATKTDPVGGRWLGLKLGVAARAIRDDRILEEALATGGDLRRLSDLFGISIDAASRYLPGVDPERLKGPSDQ